jgi:hypothetical protein
MLGSSRERNRCSGGYVTRGDGQGGGTVELGEGDGLLMTGRTARMLGRVRTRACSDDSHCDLLGRSATS